MTYRSFNSLFPFMHLLVGREGAQCERAIRAICFLLYGWAHNPGQRDPSFDEKLDEKEGILLSSIAFDKLAMFFHRIWNELFCRYSKKVEEMIESREFRDAPKMVTFPSPFQEVTGKHGRGAGRFGPSAGVAPTYILEILYSLQKDSTVQYFEIFPPPKGPDSPTHHLSTVKAAIEITDVDQFLEGYTDREIQLLKDLENSLRHLGGSHIRALGTHSSFEKTKKDIKREFKHLEPYRDATISNLANGECFLQSSYVMLTYAQEAYKKSKTNRDDYQEALQRMTNFIRDVELKDAFLKIQKSPADIWNGTEIKDLADHSEKALALSKYINAIAYFRTHIAARNNPRTKDDKKYTHRWKESVTKLRQNGPRVLPFTINGVFVDNTAEIKPGVRDRLIKKLQSL